MPRREGPGADDVRVERPRRRPRPQRRRDRPPDYVDAPYELVVLEGVSHWIPTQAPEATCAERDPRPRAAIDGRDASRPPAGAGAAAAPGGRQPLPPRHRARTASRVAVPRRRSPRPPPSACPGSCRSAATCPARGGRSRPRRRTTRWSPASRCTPTRRRGSADALDDGDGRDRGARRRPRQGAGGGGDRARPLPHRRGRAGPRRWSRSGGTSTSPSGSTRPWSSTTATPTTRCCDVLDEEGAPDRWVMHCFSGDADVRPGAASTAAPTSRFAGTVTFKNAEPLRDALAVAPRDRVLVETDAPYLTPMPLPRPHQRVVPRAAHDAGDGGGPRRRPRGALRGRRRQHRGGVRRRLVAAQALLSRVNPRALVT